MRDGLKVRLLQFLKSIPNGDFIKLLYNLAESNHEGFNAQVLRVPTRQSDLLE